MNFITEEEIDRVLGKINNSTKGSKVKGEILEYFTKQPLETPKSKELTNTTQVYSSDTYSGFRRNMKQQKTNHTRRVHKPYIEQEFTRKIRRVPTGTQITKTRTITRTLTNKTQATKRKASVIARTYAMLVDMSIVALVQSFILFTAYKLLGKDSFYSILHINGINKETAIILVATMLLAYISMLAFYLMFFETLSGQSIGKLSMGIKVVSKDTNEKAPVFNSLLRVIGFFLLFPLSLFGLHELISNTKVKSI